MMRSLKKDINEYIRARRETTQRDVIRLKRHALFPAGMVNPVYERAEGVIFLYLCFFVNLKFFSAKLSGKVKSSSFPKTSLGSTAITGLFPAPVMLR